VLATLTTSGSGPRTVGIVGYWWSANRISESNETDGEEYKHRLWHEACLLYTLFVNSETTAKATYYGTNVTIFSPMAQQPPVGQGLLIIEDAWSHSDTPQTLELLWTSDQTEAETSNWQGTALIRERHSCHRRDSNPQSQQASGHRPTS
jgi:hypothetical protein